MKKGGNSNKKRVKVRSKWSKLGKWLLTPTTIIGLVGFGWLGYHHYYVTTYIEPKTEFAKGQMKQELAAMKFLPDDALISSSEVKKGTFTSFFYKYKTSSSWDEFVSFYVKNAESSGWVLKRDRIEGSARDLEFLRGEYYLSLCYYNLQGDNPSFSVSLRWDYDEIGRNYLLSK